MGLPGCRAVTVSACHGLSPGARLRQASCGCIRVDFRTLVTPVVHSLVLSFGLNPFNLRLTAYMLRSYA